MDGRRLLRAVLAGGAAALLCGVAAALVFRLLMRAVGEVTSTAPTFSLAGTGGIAVFLVVLALPGAIALACSRSRWPWLVLGTGLGLLAVQAVGIGAEAGLIGRTARRWARTTAPAPAPALTPA